MERQVSPGSGVQLRSSLGMGTARALKCHLARELVLSPGEYATHPSSPQPRPGSSSIYFQEKNGLHSHDNICIVEGVLAEKGTAQDIREQEGARERAAWNHNHIHAGMKESPCGPGSRETGFFSPIVSLIPLYTTTQRSPQPQAWRPAS